jgi:hypothetical protein
MPGQVPAGLMATPTLLPCLRSAAAFTLVAIALLKCQKGLSSATTKTRIEMSALCALILLGFAALAAVLLAAFGIDRGAKNIDRQRSEHLEDGK